ncbi:MAG TPA: ATP-grasp domain-containing protein [Candidatus Desulfovibrio intestinipullorum]|uniref:ATP-grasp domain-containing protein n=1 Tax=Candidatus Desulfovibrio intestinipullorum TaxID=2838536 RepID=A0A9D1PXI9_9BACT|nr:ATP-grasp domain-containing protein [Candidatus Desulfovibrio intestinipullorum]
MIILEEPYISRELAQCAARRGEPVLDTASAREAERNYQVSFNLLDDAAFAARCRQGERLYTNSENALDWLYAKSGAEDLIAQVEKLKNKARLRRELSDLYPDYFFMELSQETLMATEADQVPMPCVLKPSVGFCSLGVYCIENAEQWQHAKADIAANMASWCAQYPAAVLGDQSWIVESLIRGTEYAVDVYFDADGRAVVCNILQHDFASAQDVSDRLYYTGADIIRRMLEPLENWFNTVNAYLKLRNFPAHVELRCDENGFIVPIEFNPLRFAGLSCTDISLFAWGFASYECFLDNTRPDWDTLLQGKEGKVWTLMVLNKPEHCPPVHSFDYEALCRKFRKVVCLRRGFYDKYSHFGILFTETLRSDWKELEDFARNDLTEFINK